MTSFYFAKLYDMKQFVNTDFDKIYEELSTITESSEAVPVLDLDVIEKEIANGEVLDWDAIEANCRKICKNFGDDPNSWPYQFQLMYNAYQAEKLAVILVNTPNFQVKLNSKLANLGVDVRMSGRYILNEHPHKHNELSAAYSKDNDKSVVDIISADPKINVLDKIEVKCTVTGKSPSDIHDCELLLVYFIDKDICRVFYNNNGKLTSFGNLDNTGIKAVSIKVSPTVDYPMQVKSWN